MPTELQFEFSLYLLQLLHGKRFKFVLKMIHDKGCDFLYVHFVDIQYIVIE